MEKLPGIKVIGNIDLSQFEKKKKCEVLRTHEQILSAIDNGMEYSIPLIQERISQFEGSPENLLNNQGQINTDSFETVYGKETVDFDNRVMLLKKKGFYQTYRKDLQERYGVFDEDKLLDILQNETKERMRDNQISENILFLLLNKISGDRYIVAKSSDYDDYENGTDMFLVDTISGKTICAFDATVENEKDKKSRMSSKIKRALKRNEKGRGMEAKYGIHFNTIDDKPIMKLGAIDHIPISILNIEKQNLMSLSREMDFEIDSEISDVEKKVINNLIKSLDTQSNQMENSSNQSLSYNSLRQFSHHLQDNLNKLETKKAA